MSHRLSGFAILAAVLLLAAAVPAQSCPQGSVVLAISPANPVPGSPIAISVTGTPGASVLLLRGATPGQTTLSGGALAGTVVCLAAPFSHSSLGHIPSSGTLTVPSTAPPAGAPGTMTRWYQAVTVLGAAGAQTWDTSNTDSLVF